MLLLQDIRLGARRLRHDWPFTAAAVFVLALGLAATNTMFTITYSLFFRPLPFADPDRVVVVTTEDRANASDPFHLASLNDIEAWRHGTTVQAIAAFDYEAMNLADDVSGSQQVSGVYLSAGTFSLLGVRPILGRDFRLEEDQPRIDNVVMLSERVWRTRYAEDRSIVGRSVRINGAPATVIGIMPPGFRFPNDADAWQPFGAMPAARRNATTERTFTGIARLKPGVSFDQALADLTAAARANRQSPSSGAVVRPRIRDFRRLHVGDAATPVFQVLMTSVAFVLLIACANVANLLLTRAARRARDVSIRLSVGASRGRIVRELLAESAVLAAAAAIAGWWLSVVALITLRPVFAGANPPYWFALDLDARVFLTFAAISVATVFVFGLAPALHTTRVRAVDALNDGARGATLGVRSRRWTAALVVSQLALTVILLTCASLSIHDLVADLHVDAGVDVRNLQITQVQLPLVRYPGRTQRLAFFTDLDERLADVPDGVATIASVLPRMNAPGRMLRTPGQPDPISARTVIVGPRYLQAFATHPVSGREFTASDSARVAMVNQRLAALIAPNRDVVGRQVRLDASAPAPATDWLTIVGVIPDIRQGSTGDDGIDPAIYLPVAAAPIPALSIIMRTPRPPGIVAALVRERMRAIDPDVPIYPTTSLETLLEANRGEGRMLSDLLGSFAAIAFILSAVGLYAMTAFGVVQRTREIGVRIAIGARTGDIVRLILRRVSVQLALGLVVGGGAAAVVARVLARAALRHVQPFDPATLGTVVLGLLAIAALGCLIPARRGALLDPVVALRAE